ncbi:SH3 domain protein [Trichinella nativa]|uniref:SH3 domain protein n=1 Tax=Trichinella nativa TaxID=6335 RepID=A0A1Y3ERV1_9BILA|nr:SH3 domain protein [Trichinella nativa]
MAEFSNETSIINNATNAGYHETPVVQFWFNRVLQTSDGIDSFGIIQWELLLILTGIWIMTYFVLWKGITEARKVWRDAGTQVFYSSGIGFGSLVAIGSHNNFNHNVYRDSIIMCLINAGTSMTAGIAVFSILGHLSMTLQIPLNDVVQSGVGLIFQVYPEAVSRLPIPQLWSVLFFLMIAILGIDSQSGQYWLTLIDSCAVSGIPLLFVAFFEMTSISWGFGKKKLKAIFKEMLGFEISKFWIVTWQYVTPVWILALFINVVIFYSPVTYPNGRLYPDWASTLGLLMMGNCCESSASMSSRHQRVNNQQYFPNKPSTATGAAVPLAQAESSGRYPCSNGSFSVGHGTPVSVRANQQAVNTTVQQQSKRNKRSVANGPVFLVALHNYESMADGDLSFKKGEIMMLLDNSNYDWWYVKHLSTEKAGYVPRTFVALQGGPESEEWFAGSIPRQIAEKLVMNAGLPRGTFLIRERHADKGLSDSFFCWSI